MNTIVNCNCGCKRKVWKDADNELTFMDELLGFQEVVFSVVDGFINGKYSLRLNDAQRVEEELQFMKNI